MSFINNVRSKLADLILPQQAATADVSSYFQALTAYQPVFSNYSGGLYEMELTRAAIDAFARHASKLHPEVLGNANPSLKRTITTRPNPWQTTTQFLYRLATIYMVNNNAVIVPIYSDGGDVIVGFNPVSPDSIYMTQAPDGSLLLALVMDGKKHFVPYEDCGLLVRHQFKDQFFGDSNSALSTTLGLINTQNEAIISGLQSSGSVRFIAKIANTVKDKTLADIRKDFVASNLGTENGGLLVYDPRISDLQVVNSKQEWVDDKQAAIIRQNVFNYFGVNDAILQNKFTDEEGISFYEGAIEPFALQLGQVQTNMVFSKHETAFGNEIRYTSSYLAFASNKTKMDLCFGMFDRGMMTPNEGRSMWQLPKVDGGDELYVRGEYVNQKSRNNEALVGAPIEQEGSDGPKEEV